jgi:DNA polymerase
LYTIEELEESINSCKRCALCETRTKCVVGGGNINSKVMLIGEAPGMQEDLSGKAFVGASGKLLDKMLESIGLDRNKVYICNIVKCRPPKNRNPSQSEVNACMDYLRYQFLIMKPKIIVLLGSVASKSIISKDFSIMKNHGKIIEKKGIFFLPTFHPSALLRDETKKALAWSDLLILQELIKNLH